MNFSKRSTKALSITMALLTAGHPLLVMADNIREGRAQAEQLFQQSGVTSYQDATSFFAEQGMSEDEIIQQFQNLHDSKGGPSVNQLQNASPEEAQNYGRSAAQSLRNSDANDATATAFGIGEQLATDRRHQFGSAEAIDLFGDNWQEVLQSTEDIWSSNDIINDFVDCEPQLMVQESQGDETVEYYMPDEQSCAIVHELTGCSMEREVTIEEQVNTTSRSSNACFVTQAWEIPGPPNAGTMFRGMSSLDIKSAVHMSASIISQPSLENGWVTTVEAQGARTSQHESYPAHLADIIPGNCAINAEGEEVCEEDVYIYDCSTAPSEPLTEGIDVTAGDWFVDGAMCVRSISGCFTPTQPYLAVDVDFEGLYLESTFIHDPNEDVIDTCITESDGWTSARWTCSDTGTRQIPSPWGGTETIGKEQLQSLVPDFMYPDDPEPVDTTISQPESDNQGGWCWAGEGEYNHETGIPEFGFGASEAYKDAYGDIQQINVELGKQKPDFRNSCGPLENNPECVFQRTVCVGDPAGTGSFVSELEASGALDEGDAYFETEYDGVARGHEGFCYVEEHVYDCGETAYVPDFNVQQVNTCNHVIQCKPGEDGSDDCFEVESASMSDFARTAALLQAADQMSNDMSCVNSQPTAYAEQYPAICTLFPDFHRCTETTDVFTEAPDPSQCKVFSGENLRCKTPLFGWVHDCCDNPTPPPLGLGAFLGGIMGASKIDSAIMAANDDGMFGGIKGSYTTLRDPITSNFQTITTPIANFKENIAGAVTPIKQSMTEFASNLTGSLTNKFASLPGVGGSDLVGMATNFKETIMSSGAGQLLGAVSTAYTVYTVAVMVIQIIWACEEDEFKLDVDKEMKKCQYIGSYCSKKISVGFGSLCVEKKKSYCCFSSPLSRIIQQQGRAQLGQSWGSPKNPSCGGLTIQQITELDWDKIDLSEWIGMLEINDLGSSKIGMDRITGSGSVFANDEPRQNAADRAVNRMDGIDVDGIQTDAAQRMPLDYLPE